MLFLAIVSRVIISIGTDAVATAQTAAADDARLEVLATNEDVAVLSVDESAIEALTEAMHAQHGRCGGFMVHDSLEDALAAPVSALDGPPVDYTLTRGAV